jgi:hypothetical protein
MTTNLGPLLAGARGGVALATAFTAALVFLLGDRA